METRTNEALRTQKFLSWKNLVDFRVTGKTKCVDFGRIVKEYGENGLDEYRYDCEHDLVARCVIKSVTERDRTNSDQFLRDIDADILHGMVDMSYLAGKAISEMLREYGREDVDPNQASFDPDNPIGRDVKAIAEALPSAEFLADRMAWVRRVIDYLEKMRQEQPEKWTDIPGDPLPSWRNVFMTFRVIELVMKTRLAGNDVCERSNFDALLAVNHMWFIMERDIEIARTDALHYGIVIDKSDCIYQNDGKSA